MTNTAQATLERLGSGLDEDDDGVADASALVRDAGAALGDPTIRIAAFCLIADKIIRRRLRGQSDEEVEAWLLTRLGIVGERARMLVGMAEAAGGAATDIGDGLDTGRAVRDIVRTTGAERPLVEALVERAVQVLTDEIPRLQRTQLVDRLMAEQDIDKETIDGLVEVANDILTRHDAGERDPEKLVEDEPEMDHDEKVWLVREALQARDVAIRFRAGDDVPIALAAVGIEHADLPLVLLALRLADERALARAPEPVAITPRD